MTFLSDLRKQADSALQVRDELGVQKADVYLVTRTWSGDTVGNGTASEAKEKVFPSPHIVDLSHNVRVQETGAVKQGDLLLKSISKYRYETEASVDCSSSAKNIEKFYEVDGKLYVVISVVSRHASWSVQVRRTSDQTRY